MWNVLIFLMKILEVSYYVNIEINILTQELAETGSMHKACSS